MKKTETQRRKDAKTQRSIFKRYRASASTLRVRRQVGSGLGKQACLPLCLPFGFGLRFAHAIRLHGSAPDGPAALRAGRVSLTLAYRAGGCPVGLDWGQS